MSLVTGGTGFLGKRLVGRLEGCAVLTRDLSRARGVLSSARLFAWDPAGPSSPSPPSPPSPRPPPPEAFEGAGAIFHLAGENVAGGRWTEARKARIRESRITGTRALVSAMAGLKRPPKVLVSASAVGFYGDRGDEPLDETAERGNDFLAETCAAWEEEAQKARVYGIRVVCLRIGMVLGPQGGALAKMLLPFRLGLGGRLGSGRQWMPWVHLDDVVGLFLHAAERENLAGPVNAVAPEPATNADFTRALGAALNRPTLFPVPAVALRLALGEFAEILLASQKIVPSVAIESGYRFRYPTLAEALRASL